MTDREYVKLNSSIQTASNTNALVETADGTIPAIIELRLPDNLFSTRAGGKKVDSVDMLATKLRVSMEDTPIAQIPMDLTLSATNPSLDASTCKLDVYPLCLTDNLTIEPTIEPSSLLNLAFPNYKAHTCTYNFKYTDSWETPVWNDLFTTTVIYNAPGYEFPTDSRFYPIVQKANLLANNHIMNVAIHGNHERLEYGNGELLIKKTATIEQMLQDALENAVTYASTIDERVINVYLINIQSISEGITPAPDVSNSIPLGDLSKTVCFWYSDSLTRQLTNTLNFGFKPIVKLTEQTLTIEYDTCPFNQIVPVFWNPAYVNTYEQAEQLTIDEIRNSVWQKPPAKRAYHYDTKIGEDYTFDYTLNPNVTCAVMNLVVNEAFKNTFSFLPWCKVDPSNMEAFKNTNKKKYNIQQTFIATSTFVTPTTSGTLAWSATDSNNVSECGLLIKIGTVEEQPQRPTMRITLDFEVDEPIANSLKPTDFTNPTIRATFRNQYTSYLENILVIRPLNTPVSNYLFLDVRGFDSVTNPYTSVVDKYESNQLPVNPSNSTTTETISGNMPDANVVALYLANPDGPNNYNPMICEVSSKIYGEWDETKIDEMIQKPNVADLLTYFGSNSNRDVFKLVPFRIPNELNRISNTKFQAVWDVRGTVGEDENGNWVYGVQLISTNDTTHINLDLVMTDGYTLTSSVTNQIEVTNNYESSIPSPLLIPNLSEKSLDPFYILDGTSATVSVSNPEPILNNMIAGTTTVPDTSVNEQIANGMKSVIITTNTEKITADGEVQQFTRYSADDYIPQTITYGQLDQRENLYIITAKVSYTDANDDRLSTHVIRGKILGFDYYSAFTNPGGPTAFVNATGASPVTYSTTDPQENNPVSTQTITINTTTTNTTEYSPYNLQPGINEYIEFGTQNRATSELPENPMTLTPSISRDPKLQTPRVAGYIPPFYANAKYTGDDNYSHIAAVPVFEDEEFVIWTDDLPNGVSSNTTISSISLGCYGYPEYKPAWNPIVPSNRKIIGWIIPPSAVWNELDRAADNTSLHSGPEIRDNMITPSTFDPERIMPDDLIEIVVYSNWYYINSSHNVQTVPNTYNAIDIRQEMKDALTNSDDAVLYQNLYTYNMDNLVSFTPNSTATDTYVATIDRKTTITTERLIESSGASTTGNGLANVHLKYMWNNLPIVVMSPIQSIVLTLNGIHINQEIQPINPEFITGSSLTSSIPIIENYFSYAQTLRDLHDELLITRESFDDAACYSLDTTSGQERTLTMSIKYITKDGRLHQLYIPKNGVFTVQLTFGLSFYLA